MKHKYKDEHVVRIHNYLFSLWSMVVKMYFAVTVANVNTHMKDMEFNINIWYLGRLSWTIN